MGYEKKVKRVVRSKRSQRLN